MGTVVTFPLRPPLPSDLPHNATPVVASSGNLAALAGAATLGGVAGKTTFITGFSITGAGATAASVVLATVTGLIGGVTLTYVYPVVAGAAVRNGDLNVTFPKPIPAAAVNTAIAVNLPSLGAGNTNAAVVAHGYQL